MNKEQELELYQSIDISDISNSYDLENDIEESYELFNNSLEYARNGSEDIALICLKKAVAANKGFLEAYNLMTLISLLNENVEAAVKYSNIVLKNDESNDKALRYLQYIYSLRPEMSRVQTTTSSKETEQVQNRNKTKNINMNKTSANESKKNVSPKAVKAVPSKNMQSTKAVNKTSTDNKALQMKNSKKNKYKKLLSKKYRFNVLAYSCVLVAIILIVFSVIFIAVTNLSGSKHKENVAVKSNTSSHHVKKSSESKDKKSKDDKKTVAKGKDASGDDNQSESTNTFNEATPSPSPSPSTSPSPAVTNNAAASGDSALQLNQANTKLSSKDYAGAEDALKGIDKAKLNAAQQTQYQNIAGKLNQLDGQNNYQKGYMYYNKRDFATAIPYLERYLASAKSDQSKMWALYYAAKSYYSIGNKEKVSQYVQTIKSEFPNSEAANYVGSWKNLQ